MEQPTSDTRTSLLYLIRNIISIYFVDYKKQAYTVRQHADFNVVSGKTDIYHWG
jgi:hypothetical protein